MDIKCIHHLHNNAIPSSQFRVSCMKTSVFLQRSRISKSSIMLRSSKTLWTGYNANKKPDITEAYQSYPYQFLTSPDRRQSRCPCTGGWPGGGGDTADDDGAMSGGGGESAASWNVTSCGDVEISCREHWQKQRPLSICCSSKHSKSMFFCFHRCVCYTSLFEKENLWLRVRRTKASRWQSLYSCQDSKSKLLVLLWYFLLTSWPDTCYPGVGVSTTEGPALGAGVRQWPQPLRVPIWAPLSPAIGDTLPHGAPGL